MPTLKELADRVALRFKGQARAQHRASLFVKITLITLGAAAAATGLAVDLATANGEWSFWTVGGIAGTVLVAIGGVYVLITERDVSETLDDAREALEKAREFDEEKNVFEANIDWLNNEVRRGLELYNSMDVMRGFIEQSLDLPHVSVAGIVQNFLIGAQSSLHVALDFEIGDTWTICVYEARRDQESGKVKLHCVAHDRTIQCEINEARIWQEGNGVAGVAYSTGSEIIVPDIYAPELGTTFALKENFRDHDKERYHSMIAVPVMVGSGKIPWGVVIATSNRPRHFHDEPVDGVPTSEPARAIAAMVALAVKALAKPAGLPVAFENSTYMPTLLTPDDGHRGDKIRPKS
jgi:hypothetical protein